MGFPYSGGEEPSEADSECLTKCQVIYREMWRWWEVGGWAEMHGMRPPRWKAPPEHPAGYYHCVSRVVDRRFAFEAREREKFRQFLTEYSAFCGVQILTWCILSNHFHLLLEVPRKPEEPPPLEDLIARLESLSSTVLSAGAARQLIARWQAS